MSCTGCLLNRTSKKAKLLGHEEARFLVVCNPPNPDMLENNEPFSYGAMKVFAHCMGDAGFEEKDFVYFPYVRCVYDKDTFVGADNKKIEKQCRNWLKQAIDYVEPDCIIPLGAEAAKAVEGRAVKISKVRGIMKLNQEHECFVLPMTDPQMVYDKPSQQPIFASDCNTLARIEENDWDVEKAGQDVLGDYEIVTDLQFLIDQEPEILSFDCETTNYEKPGPRWQDPDGDIVSMQFSTEPGVGYMVVLNHSEYPTSMRLKSKLKKQLEQLLTNPKTRVIGQNLKFDVMWVYSRFGFRFRIDHDTLMMAALVDENSVSKDLDTLVKIYAPAMAGYADQFNNAFDKSRMDLVPLNKLLDYGCGDTDATFRVYLALRRLIENDEQLWEHYRNVSMPGINAFVPVEKRGMLIDESALDDFEQVLAQSIDEQFEALIKEIPNSIKRKHANDPKRKKIPLEKTLAMTRAAFMLDVLFHHPDGFKLKPIVFTEGTKKLKPHLRVPNLSAKDHLPYFFEECPFTERLALYKQEERLLGTNVRKFRENYITKGKIHPVYSLWTAVTGRTASRDPNGQNFPKRGKAAKAYRKIFVAPPGYVILGADLSQAELRISADMANERVMIDIYRSGGDIHSRTAAGTMGIPIEQFMAGLEDQTPLIEVANSWPGSGVFLRALSDEKRRTVTVAEFCVFKRFQAKAINFGFIYGMGFRKFVGYAKTQYGVEFTDAEAEQTRYDFFDTYPRLSGWHAETRAFVREYGYIRSYSGRVRHLPDVWSQDRVISSEAERQAINSPVQEFASSLGVMSMGRLDAEVDDRCLAMTGFVHDALYALVKKEHIEWGAKTLKHYMETNPLDEYFGLELKLPIVADVEFGLNGGATHEMKGLNLNEEYDFERLGELGFELPPQRIPENNGRIDQPEHLQIHW